MRNLTNLFFKRNRSKANVQINKENLLTFVKAGEVHNSDIGNTQQRLAAKLNIDEACVVFYAWYDNHEGFRSKNPTIVMLHWAKNNNGQIKKTLSHLLSLAADEQKGIGSLHEIKVYVVSHPGNIVGFDNKVCEEIGKIAPDLFLAPQSEKTAFEYDDEADIKFNYNKIKCVKLEEFEINNMTGLPGIIGVNISNTQPSSKSSESPRPR